jgi:hypothetical protein
MNRRAAAAAALLACAIAAPALAAPALPNGVADPAKVSVSGISSGGYMAVQMHFAHAETFRLGAGVVAGGPRNCAQGSVLNALGRCMKHLGDIPVDDLVAETRRDAASQRLAPLADVSAGKVYLFSGTRDETVVPAVMADLKRFYLAFLPAASVVMKNDLPASHSFVTEDFGPACDRQSEHFLNDCEFDLAGAILGTLAGDARGRLPLPRAARANLPARRLHAAGSLRAACRLPWLQAEHRHRRAGLHRPRGLQRLGRDQPHHRALPAGREDREQSEWLLGLVGPRRSALCDAPGTAGARGDGDGAPPAGQSGRPAGGRLHHRHQHHALVGRPRHAAGIWRAPGQGQPAAARLVVADQFAA